MMPLAHGGDVKRATEKKTLARIRKVIALHQGERPTMINDNPIIEAEPVEDVAFRLGQIVPIAGVPRVRDLDLAEQLGMADPHAIRRIIAKHRETLETWGEVSDAARKPSEQGGRPGREYWLNRKQALYVCAKSDTESAARVTVALVDVFSAWEAGKIVPAEHTDPAALIASTNEAIAILQARIAELEARPITQTVIRKPRFIRPSIIRRLAA